MARQLGRLSAVSLKRPMEVGLHPDGGGLYVRVTKSGGKFWIFRFMLHKKAREMGLGALHALSQADARIKAAECRKLLSEGIDPIEARDAAQTAKRLEAARAMTFKQCAEAYIAAHKAGWRNSKHAAQWASTLATYAYPIFGDMNVQDIDLSLVTKVLEPIWNTKTETASRVRGRIENILDWAVVREYRRGENPARWRGYLDNIFPPRSKIQKTKHHRFVPYEQVGDLMAALKHQEGIAAKAMAFTILTGARTNETLKTTWGDIDLQKKIWVVPEHKMKTEREHRVPLSEPVIRILMEMKKMAELLGMTDAGGKNNWVFPGMKQHKPLSNMAMLMLLKRMKWHDKTVVHGFRSTFRTWAEEQTNFGHIAAETSISHAVGNKVTQSYLRTDMLEKRRKLMDAWARYCMKPSAAPDSQEKVVAFTKQK